MKFSPGRLCSPHDDSYIGFVHGIHKCGRVLEEDVKSRLSHYYKIQERDFVFYEKDHLIPLGIGGSNDISNIWPQPGPSGKNEVYLRSFEFEFNFTNTLFKSPE
jgi:hypothetical protein